MLFIIWTENRWKQELKELFPWSFRNAHQVIHERFAGRSMQ